MVDEKARQRPQAVRAHGSADVEARRWPALLLLCAAQLVAVMNFQIANVALPLIGAGLGFSQGSLQWVISANALAYGGTLLLAGRLADLFGHRRLFMAGLALFALGSLGCGLAPGQSFLLIARAAQGLGAALFTPATLALLADTFPAGRERNRALGIWGAAGPIGGIVGLLAGGGLAAAFGWRWIFFLIVPIAAATLLATPFTIAQAREDRGAERPDWAGAAVGTGAIVALVYGLNGVTGDGNRALGVALPLVAGAVLLVLFVGIERRIAAPLVPLGIFRRRELMVANIATFLQGASTNTPIFFFTLFLQEVRGQSALATGLAFLPCNLALIIGSGIGTRAADRFGYQRTLIAGMSLIIVSLFLLARISPDGGYATTLLPGILFEGLGLGIAQVAAIGLGTAQATGEERGLAAGLLNTGAQVGTAVGLSVLVTIATTRTDLLARGAEPTAAMLTDGFRWAFFVGGVLTTLGLLTAFAMGRGASDARSESWADTNATTIRTR